MGKHFVSLIVAFCLIIIGAFITFYEALDFNISDKLVNYSLSKKTITYDLTNINDEVVIHTYFGKTYKILYDNNITPGNYKIVVTYYNELVRINKYSSIEDGTEYVNIDIDGVNDFDTFKKLVDITISGLKEKIVYNYYRVIRPDIKVYINEIDKNKIVLED